MSAIVTVEGLCKQYDPPRGVMAVKEISFTIERGEIFSLLGPNGAGKTTTIGMLNGLLIPTSGEAVIDGHSIITAASQAKECIGVVPEEIALYSGLSAHENLDFWGKMYGLDRQLRQKRITEVLEIVDLTDRAKDKVSTFSGGMKRRLNIAVGLLHNPKIVYMDEPTVGIDPQSRRRILDTVKELNRQGMTILYTTHYMEEAEELSHRVGVIDHGELIALGTQEELASLVGEYDTVQLVPVGTDLALQSIADSLKELSGVHQACAESDQLIVQAKDASNALPQIVSYFNQTALPLKRIDIQEPNLETLFLHLTGRTLRD
jgi:ABC-2 type transport system ATP-binding protein